MRRLVDLMGWGGGAGVDLRRGERAGGGDVDVDDDVSFSCSVGTQLGN